MGKTFILPAAKQIVDIILEESSGRGSSDKMMKSVPLRYGIVSKIFNEMAVKGLIFVV